MSILKDVKGFILEEEKRKLENKHKFLEIEIKELKEENKSIEESVNIITQENIKLIKEKIIFQLLSGKHVIDIQSMYRYYEDIVWKYENERDEYPGQSIESFIFLIWAEALGEFSGNVEDFFNDYDAKIIVTPKNYDQI